MDSILTSMKKMLGIEEDYEAFDMDLIININSVFTILNQLGIGPEDGYMIAGKENLWEEFLIDDANVEAVKSYMYLKLRLLFDPPSNSFLVTSLENQVKEFEWRLAVQVEKGVDGCDSRRCVDASWNSGTEMGD